MSYKTLNHKIFASLCCVLPLVASLYGLSVASGFLLIWLVALPGIASLLWNYDAWYNQWLQQMPVVALLAAILALSMFGLNPVYSAVYLGKVAGIFIVSMLLALYINTWQAVERQCLAKHLYAAFFGCILILLLLIFAHPYLMLYLTPYLSPKAQRLGLAYFNRSASFVSLFTWFAIGYMLQRGNSKGAIAVGAIMLVIFLCMESEATSLGFAISGVVTIAIWWAPILRAPLAIGVGLVLCAIPLLLSSFQFIPQTLNLACSHSWAHRIYLWDNVLDLALRHPWTGWGFGSATLLAQLPLGEVDCNNSEMMLFPTHPHSGSLQMFLELGVGGLLLYSAFWSLLLWRICYSNLSRATKTAMLGMCITYIVISTCSYNIWISWWLISFMLQSIILLQLEFVPKKTSQTGED